MPTLVQSTSAGPESSATISLTLGNNTTLGNCLVVCAGNGATAGDDELITVISMTLNGVDDNFALAESSSESIGRTIHLDCEIWTDQDIGQASTAVVVNWTGGVTSGFAWAMEWSGINTSDAVDQKEAGASESSSTFSAGPTGTLAQSTELVVGAVIVGAASAPGIDGPSSPWVNLSPIIDDTNLYGFGAGYNIVSSDAAQTYSGSFTTADSYYAAVIVTLLASATPSSPASFIPTRLSYFPAYIVSNSGWRSGGHSR